jgi:DNA-binding NtrC family response regulator
MKTILLVEDDAGFAHATFKALSAAGYSVIIASSTLAGLREVESDAPIDLIITDIKMPPGQPHGIAFAKMAHMKRPSLPIIYTTAFRGLGEFIDDTDRVLYKPIDEDALVNEVRIRLA